MNINTSNFFEKFIFISPILLLLYILNYEIQFILYYIIFILICLVCSKIIQMMNDLKMIIMQKKESVQYNYLYIVIIILVILLIYFVIKKR